MQKVQKATIFVAVITSFITTFMGSALNLSVPDMSNEFHVGAGAIGWVVTVYMLIAAAFSVPFGRIADLTSRKRILVCGITIFGVASCFGIFAGSLPAVIFARGAQGLGASMIFATNHAILVNEFDESSRGRVLGYATASTYMGLAMGPVIGGFLNYNIGWRSIFAVSFVISLLVLIEAVRRLSARKSENADQAKVQGISRWDLSGNIIFIAMILTGVYGLTELVSSKLGPYFAAAGFLLGIWFVLHERKAESPIIDVRIFTGNPSYALSNLAALLNYGATYAISYLLSIYLQIVSGFTSQTAGLVLIASPAVMALFSPYAGKLSDRMSPFKLASAGMAITAVSLLIFTFIGENTSILFIVATLLLSGFGFALFSSPNTNAIMSSVESESLGIAASILATMRSLGHTVSMAVVMIIASLYMGDSPLAEAEPQILVQTMHISYIVFTVLSALGIFCSLKRKNVRRVLTEAH